MTRYFCFRFDVDTHRCVRRGVPNLLDLAARIDARFTLFVNMGRAVSRLHAVRRVFQTRPGGETAAKLPTRRKLGLRDGLVAATLNPTVGAGSPGVLQRADAEGHEIGLHGGGNHAIWQAEARGWPEARLRGEVEGALQRLEAATGRRPEGFASPGWNTPDRLPGLLEELGFRYLADRHGPAGPEIGGAPESGVVTVNTALTGEPGGVAYLEHLRARGLADADIADHFRRRLDAADRLAVVYDHPYFAGIRALDLVARLVEIARDRGFQVVPLRDAVRSLHSGGSGE